MELEHSIESEDAGGDGPDEFQSLQRGRRKAMIPAREPVHQPLVSKTVVNFFLDSILLVFMMGLLFTAATLRFVFPSPTAADGWTLWGFGYDAWANLQFVLVVLFGLAVVLHVMLHWAWVCCVLAAKILRGRAARPDEGQQTIWGVGLLIVVVNVIGVALGMAYLSIQAPIP